jgi:hypothetical protein
MKIKKNNRLLLLKISGNLPKFPESSEFLRIPAEKLQEVFKNPDKPRETGHL